MSSSRIMAWLEGNADPILGGFAGTIFVLAAYNELPGYDQHASVQNVLWGTFYGAILAGLVLTLLVGALLRLGSESLDAALARRMDAIQQQHADGGQHEPGPGAGVGVAGHHHGSSTEAGQIAGDDAQQNPVG